MKKILILLTFFLWSETQIVQACIWDSDTLKVEAEGLPSVVDTIAGRFKRFPKEYYQFRIDRLNKQKTLSPFDYDDLAVAYDRIGNSQKAIDVILSKMKLSNLEFTSSERKDIRYKSLANLGTFQAHLWFKQTPKNRVDSLLDKSIDNLSKAIEINPNAHFGREKIQLALIKKIRNKQPLKIGSSLENFLPVEYTKDQLDNHKLLEGLQGIVVLGEAWNNPDIFIIMSVVLQNMYQKHLSSFAKLRAIDLLESGKKLVSFNSYDNRDFVQTLHKNMGLSEVALNNVKGNYINIMRQGQNYQNEMTQYIITQISHGKHPDINLKEFWSNFNEPKTYTMVEPSQTKDYQEEIIFYTLCLLLFILFVLISKSLRDIMFKDKS